MAWDNFCSWCDSRACRGNTVDYNDEQVSGEGGNCFVSDQDCFVAVSKNGQVLGESVNRLCELSVRYSHGVTLHCIADTCWEEAVANRVCGRL